MKVFLEKEGYNIDLNSIDKTIATIQANIDRWENPTNLAACIGYTDLTSLKSEDTPSKIAALTKKVNNFKSLFPNYPYPASICVYPNLGKTVKDNLTEEGVHITTVAGCFPTSQSFPEVKNMECKLAVANGSDEIDIVLPLNKFLDGDLEGTEQEIITIRNTVGKNTILKVIIESGALSSPEMIAAASIIAMKAGADFIKTSTGKQEPAATPMAAIVMCECIKDFYKKSGKMVGFKAAGGISTPKEALCYLAIVDTILGEKWLTPRYFRLGASRLVNNLLSELEQKTVSYF